jgi:hypothetical protein
MENVYQKNYNKEFIKELPVNFDKIKNMDLSKVEEKYRTLFTTDWNWGNHSSMKIQDRMVLQELWLEYQHSKFKELRNKNVKEEIVTHGF